MSFGDMGRPLCMFANISVNVCGGNAFRAITIARRYGHAYSFLAPGVLREDSQEQHLRLDQCRGLATCTQLPQSWLLPIWFLLAGPIVLAALL